MNLLDFSNQQLYVSNLFIIVKTNDVKQKNVHLHEKQKINRKNDILLTK